MKRLIPADTVDAAGNVWETTGENIRNGAREISERDVKLLVNVLFPVGSVYCGENNFILSVGKWEFVTGSGGHLLIGGTSTVTGTLSSTKIGDTGTIGTIYVRLWKRVS